MYRKPMKVIIGESLSGLSSIRKKKLLVSDAIADAIIKRIRIRIEECKIKFWLLLGINLMATNMKRLHSPILKYSVSGKLSYW
jgi:hypothetical protein